MTFPHDVQEEVLADPHWLDNRWAEKDRVLTYFGRTEQFPAQVNGEQRSLWPWRSSQALGFICLSLGIRPTARHLLLSLTHASWT